MSLTVKNLIDRYSRITENVEFQLDSHKNELTEEENKVFTALNMGVVTEKVLNSRRQSRKKKC